MNIGQRLTALGAGALLTFGAAALPTPALGASSPDPAARATPPATDIPMYRIGGATGTVRSASAGPRHIVMVDDAAALDSILADSAVAASSVWRSAFYGFAADLDAASVARLRANPGVRSVEPEGAVSATATQANPPSWGLDRIDQANLPLDNAYTSANTGAGVTAYVIDSGAWMSHVEFADRIPYGYYHDFGDETGAWDCSGHGTHVSGTIGGATYGVAKQVTIIPVKVLDCDGFGNEGAMLDAIDAVIADHQPGQPAVANMSVGGEASAAVDAGVEAMIADGITVVTAAGNEGVDACSVSPARTPSAITVAASDIDDVDAEFSNYGPCLDIYAPGVGILSSYIDGVNDNVSGYLDGTSMASPHVAGVAALVLQSLPTASPADVWAAIDDAATVGVLTEFPGNPDKLVRVPASLPAPPLPDLSTVQPARLYDSRTGAGPTPGGGVTEIQVAGSGGVPADAPLAALNVTAVEPSAPGYLTVFPCGTTPPNASNVNFGTAQTIPNAVVVRIGAAGKVCVFASVTTGLLVDVNGYAPAGSKLGALDPFRLYDSRVEPVPRTPGQITEVQVTGKGGVDPAATAALLNVTAVDPLDTGYFTVYPCGANPPQASNLNFRGGQTIANAVLARIGANGRVCVYSSAAAGVIVDVNAAATPGATVVGLDPFRLVDTREWETLVPGGEEIQVYVTGFGGVPAAARTALLNVTAVDTTGAGYMTVYPCGAARPEASNLNFGPGETIPNAVIAKLGVEGSVCIYTSAGADIIVDVNGYAA